MATYLEIIASEGKVHVAYYNSEGEYIRAHSDIEHMTDNSRDEFFDQHMTSLQEITFDFASKDRRMLIKNPELVQPKPSGIRL